MGKELREFRASPAALAPVVLLVVVCTVLPFLVVVVVPWGTGQSLTSDKTFLQVLTLARQRTPDLAALPVAVAAEVFLLAVLVVLPLIGMLLGQIAGAFFITTAILLALCVAMAAVWVVLIFLSVALFERETILTRWT